MSQLLSIKLINQDTALQPRAKMDTAIIDEYKESMKAGDGFPPVIVYKIGEEFVLVDGYHRYLAAKGAKKDKILAEVRIGTMRDAILASVGVNAVHGVRRTNDDKHRAIMILLRDPEWEKWSDSEIAKACKVGTELVAKTRKSILAETARYRTDTPEPTPEKRKVKRAGKTYEMKTEKIGKKDPVVLHPSIKAEEPDQLPTSPSQPARHSIEVTDDPPQPSLLSQMAASKLEIVDGSAIVTPIIQQDTQQPRIAPCMLKKPCPDGKDHKAGKKCALWNILIGQFFKDECYLDARARKDAEKAAGGESLFQRASGLNLPPVSTQTLPTIGKHPLLKTRKEQDAATSVFIDNCLTDRYHRVIRDAMTDHALSTPLDAICRGLDLLSEWEGEK
jgi:hypothetical protein